MTEQEHIDELPGKPKKHSVEDVLICNNCLCKIGDCECGSWSPVYLNEFWYLKNRKSGAILKVLEHPAMNAYFIAESRVPIKAHYPKRLIRYYSDFTPATSEQYDDFINSKK
jgi:hypothetical protein